MQKQIANSNPPELSCFDSSIAVVIHHESGNYMARLSCSFGHVAFLGVTISIVHGLISVPTPLLSITSMLNYTHSI